MKNFKIMEKIAEIELCLENTLLKVVELDNCLAYNDEKYIEWSTSSDEIENLIYCSKEKIRILKDKIQTY